MIMKRFVFYFIALIILLNNSVKSQPDRNRSPDYGHGHGHGRDPESDHCHEHDCSCESSSSSSTHCPHKCEQFFEPISNTDTTLSYLLINRSAVVCPTDYINGIMRQFCDLSDPLLNRILRQFYIYDRAVLAVSVTKSCLLMLNNLDGIVLATGPGTEGPYQVQVFSDTDSNGTVSEEVFSAGDLLDKKSSTKFSSILAKTKTNTPTAKKTNPSKQSDPRAEKSQTAAKRQSSSKPASAPKKVKDAQSVEEDATVTEKEKAASGHKESGEYYGGSSCSSGSSGSSSTCSSSSSSSTCPSGSSSSGCSCSSSTKETSTCSRPCSSSSTSGCPDSCSSTCDDIESSGCFVQWSPPWPLAQISNLLDEIIPDGEDIQASFMFAQVYTYPNSSQPVRAYVLSTGIRVSSADFRGRAILGPNFVTGEPNDDLNGAGTAIAGVIGGATFGVSKTVILVSVKAFDIAGGSFLDTIFPALEYVVDEHLRYCSDDGPAAVLDLSFIGPLNLVLNGAVEAAGRSGIHIATTAGLFGELGGSAVDACTLSPSSAGESLTVAQQDIDLLYYEFQNYGACIDLEAPGVDVSSIALDATSTFPVDLFTGLGTAMTSGVLALLLSTCQYASYSPTGLRKVVLSMAIAGGLDPTTIPAGTVNLVLSILGLINAFGCNVVPNIPNPSPQPMP